MPANRTYAATRHSDILLNFRFHKVVFTIDIQKMYRQIMVRKEDRKYQHIWWRFVKTEPFKKYELKKALRVLKQLVEDKGDSLPLASQVLRDAIHIDDIIAGTDTLEEVCIVQQKLIVLLSRGGFQLSKWASNNPKLLKAILSDQQRPLSISTN